jgi:hypothetical protein
MGYNSDWNDFIFAKSVTPSMTINQELNEKSSLRRIFTKKSVLSPGLTAYSRSIIVFYFCDGMRLMKTDRTVGEL